MTEHNQIFIGTFIQGIHRPSRKLSPPSTPDEEELKTKLVHAEGVFAGMLYKKHTEAEFREQDFFDQTKQEVSDCCDRVNETWSSTPGIGNGIMETREMECSAQAILSGKSARSR